MYTLLQLVSQHLIDISSSLFGKKKTQRRTVVLRNEARSNLACLDPPHFFLVVFLIRIRSAGTTFPSSQTRRKHGRNDECAHNVTLIAQTKFKVVIIVPNKHTIIIIIIIINNTVYTPLYSSAVPVPCPSVCCASVINPSGLWQKRRCFDDVGSASNRMEAERGWLAPADQWRRPLWAELARRLFAGPYLNRQGAWWWRGRPCL